jgi:hypothetical protein
LFKDEPRHNSTRKFDAMALLAATTTDLSGSLPDGSAQK